MKSNKEQRATFEIEQSKRKIFRLKANLQYIIFGKNIRFSIFFSFDVVV